MREFLKSGIVGIIPNKPNFYEVNYNEAIELDNIKLYLKEIYERWNRLGFTGGLEGDVQKKCAYAFEQLAQYLIYEVASDEDRKYFNETNFETIGFPIIRRVLTNIDRDGIEFDFNSFLKYYKLFDGNKILDLIKGIGLNGTIDDEAEACASISEMIIEIFKNPGADIDAIKGNEYDRIKNIKYNINERTRNNHTDA